MRRLSFAQLMQWYYAWLAKRRRKGITHPGKQRQKIEAALQRIKPLEGHDEPTIVAIERYYLERDQKRNTKLLNARRKAIKWARKARR